LLFTLVLSLASVLLAQQTTSSLADIARQEREKRTQPTAKPVQTKISVGSAGMSNAAFQANILITDSKEAIGRWVLLPAAERAGTGRIRRVTPGMKMYVPLVVTNYGFPASENMYLTAQVRLSNPDGKTLFDVPKMSGAISPDPRSPSVIVLNPLLDLTFDTKDRPGRYTIQVTITDHFHSTSATAEETFELIQY